MSIETCISTEISKYRTLSMNNADQSSYYLSVSTAAVLSVAYDVT